MGNYPRVPTKTLEIHFFSSNACGSCVRFFLMCLLVSLHSLAKSWRLATTIFETFRTVPCERFMFLRSNCLLFHCAGISIHVLLISGRMHVPPESVRNKLTNSSKTVAMCRFSITEE